MNGPRLWAPEAKRVELVSRGERTLLTRKADGMWVLAQPLPPGTDYAFSVDGGQPLPDPRSREQPEGVHGPSRWVGTDFAWTDQAFRAPPLGSAVIYELHVGTFSTDGTFEGVIERLSHLQKLGITHVELLPVAEFPGSRGWGYDVVDLYAPHHAYGGSQGLKRLVDACHARGLAVLLDVVYNHLGPDGNYLPSYGPYLTDAYKTPWGSAVNLDGPHSTPVRRFFIDNALHWLSEYHFDGLRLDAVHALYDHSALHFLQQMAEEVALLSDQLAKPLVLIAESDLNDPRLVRPREASGFGLDAQWCDDLHHTLHSLLTGERQGYYEDFGQIAQLARALENGYLYEGQYSAHRKRNFGYPFGDLSRRRLVTFLQNHDQVGNRARGERIGHQTSARRVQLGAALVLLGPAVPMLFQGEEWNASAPFQYFTDHQDAKLGDAVREGRRREFAAFGWAPEDVPDPQAAATFEASRLDFSEIEAPQHAHMLAFYRELISIRRRRPEFLPGRVRVRFDEAAGWLVMQRDQSSVAVNFSNEQRRVAAFDVTPTGDPRLLYATEGARLQGSEIFLPAESLAVIVCAPDAEGLP
ncbi:MAG TPA: malto-oligosyltrehalose trehalohydrolase [Polyangiaceae bacterium]|nr:malto-oligosyltrehalose trehalohydrolase [Polyangiaceae bacterium]